MKDAEKERMRVGKKNRIVRYAAMLFLTAAAVFAAPQKTFAEGNKTYPTGDLKPYAPKQMENEPETYEAREWITKEAIISCIQLLRKE